MDHKRAGGDRSTCSVTFTPLTLGSDFGSTGLTAISIHYAGGSHDPSIGDSTTIQVTPGATTTTVSLRADHDGFPARRPR